MNIKEIKLYDTDINIRMNPIFVDTDENKEKSLINISRLRGYLLKQTTN